MIVGRAALALTLLGSACGAGRVVQLENELLRMRSRELAARVEALEQVAARPDDYVRTPTLDTVSRFLDRAGYVHQRVADGRLIRLDYAGKNASFGLRIQHFERQDVLFIATTDYLRLDAASDSRAVVMLLVQLAALNYDLLVGKLQLDPESGEILLSAEILLDDGLGYSSFVRLLDQITRTADERYAELARAAAGQGI